MYGICDICMAAVRRQRRNNLLDTPYRAAEEPKDK